MKRKKLLAAFLSVALISSSLAGCSIAGNTSSSVSSGNSQATSSTSANGKKYKITLITMDSMDRHWVSVNEGCQKAVKELGNVEYKWAAPDTKDDAQQIERVNDAIADNVNAILIAANGPDAISSVLKEAKAKGIKIVYVDSPAKIEGEATFATDNEAAGKLAGQQMLAALKKEGKTSGKIGVVNVNNATASTISREKGFRAVFDGTSFQILATQYSQGDVAKSQNIADNYISSGVVGVFGTNEGCSTGVGNAIKSSGKKDIIGVGFDKSDALLSLVKSGALLCTIAQKPVEMGYEGMKAAVKVLSGGTIEQKVVDTGASVITKDNVDSAK